MIILSSLVFSVQCWSQGNKDQRFMKFVNALDKGSEIKPYKVVDSNSTEYLECEKQVEELNNFIKKNVDLIDKLTKDTLLKVIELKDKGGYSLSVYSRYYQQYADYMVKENDLRSKVQKLIKNDSSLIMVDFYTFESEYLFLRENFYYRNAFQPKNIDDFRYTHNLSGQCVLCYVENGSMYLEKIDSTLKHIGIFSSKYITTLTLPVVNNGQYLCDIRFTFLR
ncbi:MAG: hypothetical protein A2W97_12055 [Bacteroidetes bacterium GWE2_40_63]|nr:MAG: hypothetical protein A2W84_10090 [Bacteroidetes bacterium GWC2_40_13]OFX72803.1 MAG: hypothetical protein A2W96_14750 [Bacteroidetes bacterium GWD2_40_43]OFX92566.1 MAG: hypothetical protein A2W97_12055 [Bacteroidetes bacterium GWE2_40_63]HAZ01600.1 hypothetical protein [Marinilabiliales bacterium]HBX83510.1 hypothetical protein [Marinilabiliales bacterium]